MNIKPIKFDESSRHLIVQLEQFGKAVARATISFFEFMNNLPNSSYWQRVARKSRAARRYRRRMARINGQDPYQFK